MKVLSRSMLILGVLVWSTAGIAAAKSLCDDPKKIHHLDASTSGEVIEGPACVEVTVNVLRYSSQLVKTITFSNGPDLTSVVPAAGQAAGAAHKCPATPESTLAEAFQKLWERVNGKVCKDPANPANDIQESGIAKRLLDRQSQNQNFSASVDLYLIKLKAAIIQSDELLSAGQAPAVIKQVTDTQFQADLVQAVSDASSWRTTDDFLADVRKAQLDLAALPQRFARPITGGPTPSDPCDKAAWQEWFTNCGGESRYKLLQDQLTKLEQDALQMAAGSEEAQKIAKKAGLLNYWQTVISTLTAQSFELKTEADCGVLFNKSKQTAIKLVLTDRVVLFDGQTPQPQAKDPIVTVECGSPFSISAGVGFSTIEDREFALVKSAPSGQPDSVVRFGESARSSVHPMPMAMAHARLLDWDSHRYALHVSFGAGAAIKGQDSGGSNAEYLTGMSVSFFRTIYLTGGLHIGQQAQLAGGFKIGDIVPPDITEPPIQKGYKAGFGFAITFTKP